MTFILISGKTGVGKTHVCNQLHGIIAADKTFTVCDKQTVKRVNSADFMAHYKKGEKHIAHNSASDNDDCMEQFCTYLDGLAKKAVRPDIIITTIRETDVQHDQMSRMLALLDAYAKGTTNLAAHYVSGIKTKPIHTPFAPDALSTHAFVLHLERQPLSGSDEEQEQALAAYWDDNADKAKYALDFALARLEA